ncbi:MAG: class I SAM-dependent methyltransferase [Spirochaetia bacterium]|nr:class I SAM-dependent methyltransferase [Spirochaetia bacterium]
MTPHSPSWYDKLSETQSTYHYPWKSRLEPNHGEAVFEALLKNELKLTDTVLDIGCGSGELANALAEFCKTIYGYDRVRRFIETAGRNRNENAFFLLHDSKGSEGIRLPFKEKCIDFFISSKGPLHWIPDAPRIANPGAKIAMLVPYSQGEYEWDEGLPPDLRVSGNNKNELVTSIESRLNEIGSQIDELQICETLEWFDSPFEFKKFLTWGKFEAANDSLALEGVIQTIFDRYKKGDAVCVNHNRLIWRAQLPQ